MTTFVENVRALVGDDSTSDPTFTDAQINALENIYGGNAFLAAASLLDRLAVEEALLLKYVKTYDVVIDGTKSASVVMERAKRLREEAAYLSNNEDSDGFLIVENDDFNYLEYYERRL